MFNNRHSCLSNTYICIKRPSISRKITVKVVRDILLSVLPSPKETLIPQLNLSGPKGFDVSCRGYRDLQGYHQPPPSNPRIKSQIPTLGYLKANSSLRASHDSFFMMSEQSREAPCKNLDRELRKSQICETDRNKGAYFSMSTSMSSQNLKQKLPGDRKGIVYVDSKEGDDDQLRLEPASTPKHNKQHSDQSPENVATSDEECSARPPSEFRDSITLSPGPSPPPSPTTVQKDPIAMAEEPVFTAEPTEPDEPEFLQGSSQTPTHDLPLSPDIGLLLTQAAMDKSQISTVTPPTSTPLAEESIIVQDEAFPDSYDKANVIEKSLNTADNHAHSNDTVKNMSPPNTLPKPLLPLLLKARSTVSKETSSDDGPVTDNKKKWCAGNYNGNDRDVQDNSGQAEATIHVCGLKLKMERKGSLQESAYKPFMGRVGMPFIWPSFNQISNVGKERDTSRITHASSLSSERGGLGSTLKRESSLPDSTSPIVNDSKHSIWVS